MFLYIKDYFQKRIFHILLILFCSLLTFNSIMTLIDLKNYEVVIDNPIGEYGYDDYYKSEEVDGQRQFTFEQPKVKVVYKYADMLYKPTWISTQILTKNLNVNDFTVEYKIYNGETIKDSFTVKYGNEPQEPIQKKYDIEHITWACVYNVVGYDIQFNAWVYLPHIFVIVGSLFFIIPSAIMLFKIKKEE